MAEPDRDRDRDRAGRSIFFDMHAPPDEDMAVGNPDPDGPRPDFVVPYFEGRIETHDLVSQKADDGMRLSILRLAPGTVLPRHSHSVDYIEFVLEGEIHYGNRIVGPGGGVYRPAGAPYTYRVGPAGATIIDVRAHTYYSTTWLDDPKRVAGPRLSSLPLAAEPLPLAAEPLPLAAEPLPSSLAVSPQAFQCVPKGPATSHPLRSQPRW